MKQNKQNKNSTKKVLKENKTISIDEKKNLEEIGMEMLILGEKIRFEILKNNLDESEIKELEEEIKEEIKLLEKKENKARTILKDIKKINIRIRMSRNDDRSRFINKRNKKSKRKLYQTLKIYCLPLINDIALF